MAWIVYWLLTYEYSAMFGILLLCGLGLPLPEEATLLASGLLVGWQEANFLWATLACSAGILLGDFLIYAMGRNYGQQLLQLWPFSWLLGGGRHLAIEHFFQKHGLKALFFARFFPGIRIGVYAYAGIHGLSCLLFLLLDGLGVLISAPLSIWIGSSAARMYAANRQQAMDVALKHSRQVAYIFLSVIFLSLLIALLLRWFWRRSSLSENNMPFAPLHENRLSVVPSAMIVAIDGPVGAGKSTVAKEVARLLGYSLVDTGAIYRTLALIAHRQEIPWHDPAMLQPLLYDLNIRFIFDGFDNKVYLVDEDISVAIRTPLISKGASAVSVHPEVRKGLLDLQRRLAKGNHVVLEGRDIGTVVFPEAPVKFYLDADPQERARRRFLELQEKGEKTTLEEVTQELLLRDNKDENRSYAPLKAAKDAIVLDCTALSLAEVVKIIVDTVRQKEQVLVVDRDKEAC